MRIAIAVDGSPISQAAVKYAASLARSLRDGPSIQLISVDEPLMLMAEARMGHAAVERYHSQNHRYATRRAQASLARAGFAFIVHTIEHEDPAYAIVAHLKKHPCDLLVMGSHGRSAMKSAMLGSVTSKVLSHCRVPLTIVRA
jgi:nucleotide-binding universal stress UspA family protein